MAETNQNAISVVEPEDFVETMNGSAMDNPIVIPSEDSLLHHQMMLVLQGSKIQATIPGRIVKDFADSFKEGCVRRLSRFDSCLNISGGFRCAKHEYKIVFMSNTNVEAAFNFDIPDHVFEFTLLAEVTNFVANFDYCFGHIMAYSDPIVKNEKKRISVELEDERADKLKVTLWGEHADQVTKYMFNNPPFPVVLIVQYVKCKKYYCEFKLQVYAMDATGSRILTLLDRMVYNFINKSAEKLCEQAGKDYPKILDEIVGKKCLFKVDVSRYNIRNSSSEISIARFTTNAEMIKKYIDDVFEDQTAVSCTGDTGNLADDMADSPPPKNKSAGSCGEDSVKSNPNRRLFYFNYDGCERIHPDINARTGNRYLLRLDDSTSKQAAIKKCFYNGIDWPSNQTTAKCVDVKRNQWEFMIMKENNEPVKLTQWTICSNGDPNTFSAVMTDTVIHHGRLEAPWHIVRRLKLDDYTNAILYYDGVPVINMQRAITNDNPHRFVIEGDIKYMVDLKKIPLENFIMVNSSAKEARLFRKDLLIAKRNCDENHVAFHEGSPSEGNELVLHSRFGMPSLLCKPIKEERIDLDYLCDRELVQESYDQGDENVINFGVQTKGDEDLVEISTEEYQESLTLCAP
ncbi:OLC1v1005127C1 [Oldenlandia corymbosa var. corymbosa]|uniref:OLC1v1005127C1 n=1 Tax=Oldenlandia corymbosa var. corymbosa TaxID=529605 RepID=A0AAV1DE06_OLDCO|nr:OLC1v1005127C1 [Oldenlandia corymbosa var. corymbosa]